MAWATPAIVVEAYLSGAWVTITTDLTDDPITLAYGIDGNSPVDRVAKTGQLRFALDNQHNAGATLGYYSPFHASRRAGWGFSVPVRLTASDSVTTTKWRGRLTDIAPEPGQYEGRRVFCAAVDWMDDAAKANAAATILVGARGDQVFSALVGCVSTAPVNTRIGTSPDTFLFALDNVRSDTKVLSALQWLACSDLGLIYCSRDATDGQTLVYEDRRARASLSTVLVTLDQTMHKLEMPSSRDAILTRMRVQVHPRRVDTGATTVVANLDAVPDTPLAGGASADIWLNFTDPAQRDTLVGAKDCIAPDPASPHFDYTMHSARDGSGTDLTAFLTVTPTFFASTVKLTLTNTGTVAGYPTKLRVRGNGLYALNPAIAETRSPVWATYGDNVVELDMVYQSDPFYADRASQYLTGVYGSPIALVRSVSFVANQSAALLAAALQADISSRIAIVETVTGLDVSRDYFIQGVEWTITGRNVLVCTWRLAPADGSAYWLFGVAGASEFGVSTRMGF